MTKKQRFYRCQVAGGFRYPPTGRTYPEGEVTDLTDWHKDDIQAALLSGLIIETSGPGAEPALIQEDSDGEN